MQNKTRIGRQKIITWAMNIVILCLSFLLIIVAMVMIESLHSSFSVPTSENSFYYAIEGERYYNIVGGYHRNTHAGFEGNADMKEYYGVAKYYEAASLYKAYSVAGNTEQAEKYLERMKQAETEMGGWSIAKKPIHAQLGIE